MPPPMVFAAAKEIASALRDPSCALENLEIKYTPMGDGAGAVDLM